MVIFNVPSRDLEPWTFQQRGDGVNVVDLRGADASDSRDILVIAERESSSKRMFVALVDPGCELPYALYPRVRFCIEVSDDGRDFFWLQDTAEKSGVIMPDGSSIEASVLRSADIIIGGDEAAALARQVGVEYGRTGIGVTKQQNVAV